MTIKNIEIRLKKMNISYIKNICKKMKVKCTDKSKLKMIQELILPLHKQYKMHSEHTEKNKIIYLDDKKKIYIILSGLRYETRDIVKIGINTFNNEYLQSFYRSSGVNTKQQGTFMPFDGIGIKIGNRNSDVFLEKNYIANYLKEFKSLSKNDNPKILSNYNFFKRLGNCYLGLLSLLLGGPAWNNNEYTSIFKEICIKNLKKNIDIEYLLNPKTLETIQKNLEKYNTFFYDYNSKKKQNINIPTNDTAAAINDFVGTSTTVNNFNSLNFSEYEIEQLTNRNNWPVIIPRYKSPSSFKGVLYKYFIAKREILKDIPEDPKIKEIMLQKLRERRRKSKKK
jgi:hypothetical protein